LQIFGMWKMRCLKLCFVIYVNNDRTQPESVCQISHWLVHTAVNKRIALGPSTLLDGFANAARRRFDATVMAFWGLVGVLQLVCTHT